MSFVIRRLPVPNISMMCPPPFVCVAVHTKQAYLKRSYRTNSYRLWSIINYLCRPERQTGKLRPYNGSECRLCAKPAYWALPRSRFCNRLKSFRFFNAPRVVCTNAGITADQCSTPPTDKTTVHVPCLTCLWMLLVFRTQYVAPASNNASRHALLMIRNRAPNASDQAGSFVWYVITRDTHVPGAHKRRVFRSLHRYSLLFHAHQSRDAHFVVASAATRYDAPHHVGQWAFAVTKQTYLKLLGALRADKCIVWCLNKANTGHVKGTTTALPFTAKQCSSFFTD